MLCLAPIELVTDAERRLHRALSGLGPGTGVLGGLVVFVPVVDGAMQRRQADAVAFLPETVVVVRALGMGRQTGELRPNETGVWTVGGQILRLSGGGSSPAAHLRKAAELIHSTLDSGGIDPGSLPALAAIDGPITSVRDRSAGGPVACSMDAGDVLTGLRHCANIGSQGDTRVWTTADVKAALTIFGLRGPSVEELNNEGFLYSPYVLRRSRSAVGARGDHAPAVSLLSGPSTQPPAPEPPSPPAVVEPPPATERVPDHDSDHEPDPGPDPGPGPGPIQRHQPDARPAYDSGVGGLFAAPDERPSLGPPTGRPAQPRRSDRQRSARPAVLVGFASLLVLVAIAGLLLALTNGLGGADADEADAAAGGTSASAPDQRTSPPASTTSATQNVAGSTYILQALQSDPDCEENAYGEVAEFFVTTPCAGLTRSLFTTTVDDAPAVVSVSIVVMPDEASAAALQELVNTSGTGNVSDLLRAGVQIDDGPLELVAAVFDSEQSGTTVRIVEVGWLHAGTDGDEALLDEAAADAMVLEVPED